MAIDEIKKLRDYCVRNKLNGYVVLERFSDEELDEIYNGAGPDSWLPVARDILTELMKLFKPVVLIHDVQFHMSDGTNEEFDYTVECWCKNTRFIFDEKYPLIWSKWLFSRSYRKERGYWYTVMKAGNLGISGSSAFDAWIAAYRRGG